MVIEMRKLLYSLLLSIFAGFAAAQSTADVVKPDSRDLCPVCGMLVAKYPNWVATIVYQDGHRHFFDGAKDMLKFWHDPAKYAAGHERSQMSQILVTEYYGLEQIDAKSAWYVIGSDVLGPMGHELVPLASAEDAADFLKEHKGARILRFDEIDAALPFQLDQGKFD